jgi:uncharacterized protein
MTMLHILAIVSGFGLVAYVAWQVGKSFGEYRRLKQAIREGDEQARTRFYFRILVFEWVSALLAFAAMEFEGSKLTPASLELDRTTFGKWLSSLGSPFDSGLIAGVVAGLIIGLVVLSIVRIRAGRREPARSAAAVTPWWRKLVPDFTDLIPATGRERLVLSIVAVSAGICEEVVFRAWLLSALHSAVGLTGATLILVAAGLFGLAHIYQKLPGVVGTSLAGVLFCALYVGTGTLLVPIVLHCLMDLRLAILPASRPQLRRAEQT